MSGRNSPVIPTAGRVAPPPPVIPVVPSANASQEAAAATAPAAEPSSVDVAAAAAHRGAQDLSRRASFDRSLRLGSNIVSRRGVTVTLVEKDPAVELEISLEAKASSEVISNKVAPYNFPPSTPACRIVPTKSFTHLDDQNVAHFAETHTRSGLLNVAIHRPSAKPNMQFLIEPDGPDAAYEMQKFTDRIVLKPEDKGVSFEGEDFPLTALRG
jgi:hypothetical protein